MLVDNTSDAPELLAPQNFQNLDALLDRVVSIDVNRDLVRKDELGSNGFEELRPYFNAAIATCRELQKVDYSRLGPDNVEDIRGPLDAVSSCMNDIKQFALTNNWQSQRTDLINRFRRLYSGYIRAAMPVLAFSWSAERALPRQEEANRTMEAMKQLAGDAEEARNEIRQVLSSVKDAANQVGVSKYTKVFQDEATKHDDSARKWLWATALSAVALILVVGRYFYEAQAIATQCLGATAQTGITYPLLQFALARVLAFTALLYVTLWCSRSYRAHRHNAVVNRHRQNALSTFEAFVEGASDPQTKDAVRLQATTCVFSPQSTGYIQEDAEPDNPAKILEIIRGSKG